MLWWDSFPLPSLEPFVVFEGPEDVDEGGEVAVDSGFPRIFLRAGSKRLSSMSYLRPVSLQ